MAAGEATCLEATTTGEMTENREVEVEAGDLGGRDQEIVTEVCKFFLEGRCRFGESCLNRHEGSPRLEPKERKTSKEEQRKKKKGTKEKVEERKGKLPSMKTAADVISRLQWDRQLPVDKFTVGYVDRFRGVLEQPFTAFCWEDLASVDDFEVLAIPQHRIQYFKYSGTKVWEKATRMDLIFGSTGDQRGIVQVMEDVDLQKQEEEDEESDDGEVELDVQEDRTEEQLVAEEDRSTHFLAVRITDPEVVSNLCLVQESIATHEPILGQCCMRPNLFHLTIGMLRLEGAEGLVAARAMMDRLRPVVEEMFRDKDSATLEINGLSNFGQRVVYANVLPKSDFWFNALVDACKEAVNTAAGNTMPPMVKSTNSFEFVPHITIAKVSRPVARLRRSRFIPSAAYSDHNQLNFGRQVVDNLHLCVIEQDLGRDGFYTAVASI